MLLSSHPYLRKSLKLRLPFLFPETSQHKALAYEQGTLDRRTICKFHQSS